MLKTALGAAALAFVAAAPMALPDKAEAASLSIQVGNGYGYGHGHGWNGYGNGYGHGYGNGYGHHYNGGGYRYGWNGPRCTVKTVPVSVKVWDGYRHRYFYRTDYRPKTICW